MPESWRETTIQDACENLRLGRRKLLARDYGKVGRFPIIDQGQDDIAGWTDDETLLISEELPLIVFGDHTRIFKYVDRPFAVGADGTQLLKPKSDLDPLFFYFACKSLDIPSRGYNRHFTILKEKNIRYPVVTEQKKIAAILWKIQQAIEVETDLIRVSRELKAAVMKKLFTEGLNGEPQKETEIGLVPESWEVVPFGDLLITAQYGLSVRGNLSGKYPILRMNCQLDGRVHFNNLQFVELDQKTFESFRLRDGDILFNRTNSIDLVGRTAIFQSNRDTVFASYLIRLTLDTKRALPEFVNAYMNLESTQASVKSLASRGVSQANISASKLKNFLIPCPKTLSEQKSIVKLLDPIDRQISLYEHKADLLRELFSTTLTKLMSSSIRVTDLNIDTTCLESQGAAA
jgi:type I restriction enzyme, S subunit